MLRSVNMFIKRIRVNESRKGREQRGKDGRNAKEGWEGKADGPTSSDFLVPSYGR